MSAWRKPAPRERFLMPTSDDIYDWLLTENIWATAADIAKAVGILPGDFDVAQGLLKLLAEGRVRHEAIPMFGADGVYGDQSMYSAVTQA